MEAADKPAAPESDVFWMLPESVPVWLLWMRLQTQWRVGPMGHRIGLDYPGVELFLRAMGYGHQRRRSFAKTLLDVQAMESAALSEWAKQAQEQAQDR